MKSNCLKFILGLSIAVVSSHAASLLTNGGFESGFTGWTRVDQPGSDRSFQLQTGTLSPVNGFPVPPPPEGTTAAMTDSEGPGSHVLYQDFVAPLVPGTYFLEVQLFFNNGDTTYRTPATLDFSTPTLNQQFRIDIVRPTADPFSLQPADILQNVYRTEPGQPLVSGYGPLFPDLSALFAANSGQTLRLRFAEVDNVNFFNVGIDDVSIDAPAAVPEPGTVSIITALMGLTLLRRSRK